MAKKFDFKKVFLERGEIIGLGVAGVIGVSLLATSLFLPGRGLFSPGATEKIKALKEPAQRAESQLVNPENKPSKPDEIAPSAKEAQARLIKPTLDALVSTDFRGAPLGHDVFGQGAVRSMPSVLNIEEAAAKAEAVPLQSYILEVVRGQLYVSVLRGDEKSGASGDSGKASERFRGMFGGGRGGKGGFPGTPGGGGMSGKGMGMPGQIGQQGDTKGKAKKVVQVPVEKLGNDTLAEQVRPLRLAVIAASFPFKKQVEEFKAKLRKADTSDVLAENSAEPGPNGQAQASFRFLGVRVQRREIDLDGKPGPWKELDLAQDYRPYVILTGKRIEEDDPKYQPVKFPGLVMPKLMQFRPENVGKGVTGTGPGGLPMFGGGGTTGGGIVGESPLPGMMDKDKDKRKDKDKSDKPLDRYPEVEKELALLNKTLKDLEGKNVGDVVQVTRTFSPDDFDLFGTGTGAGVPPPKEPGTGEEPTPEGQGDLSKPRELPEYCLVRAIDVTVEPGKTYEYQLKVVMANPNYMRKDVASSEYAKTKKIESDWSSVPIKVSVQEDLRYYAVDQKKLEAKYDGINARTQYNDDRQLVLQAHRYLNTVNLRGGAEVLVGEWAVAERFGVFRGEYVGRTERVEVPVWKFDLEDFVVASDSTTSKRNPGIAVHFGFNARGDQPEAILVDFDTGKTNYERVVKQEDEKVETKKVTDQAHVEALMMYPDGKLILREGAIDAQQEGAEGKDPKQLTEGQLRWRHVTEARKRVTGLKKDKKEKVDRGTGGVPGDKP